jgi:glycosyltransferase involved in cell wall biosynthesis
MPPLVSVVTTTYNTGRYLPETLDSALSQTYPHREIIVVDDGSTDDTLARVRPYLDRIRFIRIEHAGLAAARNTGLQMAQGEFIALLDADDLWLPDKLAVQVKIASGALGSGLIACDGEEFGSPRCRPYLLSGAAARALRSSSGGQFTAEFHRQFIRHVNIRCPAQILLPHRIVREIGPFGDFEAQDYDYYLRVSARYPITFHAHSLVRWRDRQDSMSGPLSRRDLNWSRQKLTVLRSYRKRCEPCYQADLERQLIWNRAEAAFHHGELFHRGRALRALLLLLRRHPWPFPALPFLLALAAPRLARTLQQWRQVRAPFYNPRS